MRHSHTAIFLAALALTACGSGESTHSVEWAEVNPDDVSSEALRRAVTDEDSRKFYEARNWEAVWTDDLAQDLAETVRLAPEHALLANMFLPETIPDEPAAREAALTKAALGFASALARGRVDPAKLFDVYTLLRPKTDVVGGLSSAIGDENVGEWLASLAPQTQEYRALSKAFLHYAQLASSGDDQQIREGDALKVGMSDPRVPRLVEALKANGYLPEQFALAEGDTTYAEPVARAVSMLQAEYGLKNDGVAGKDTLEILNTSPTERARQIAVNMERRRWLDRTTPETRIDVNTAAAFLEYWRDGALRNRRVVVVGQPDWETPQLASPMFRLVANPNWTVPKSIEEDELASKGAAYFASQNIVRENGRFVQQPGPKNALGQVKFDMKNDHAIYLHDTPSKSRFQSNDRHASHGCVRVSDALGFAQLLSTDEGIADEFSDKLQKGDTAFVQMRRELPVRLLYHTAYLEGGEIRFRTDAYGWDAPIAVALGGTQTVRRKVRRDSGDIGP